MPAGTFIAAGRSACSRCWIHPDEGVGAAQRRYPTNDVMADDLILKINVWSSWNWDDLRFLILFRFLVLPIWVFHPPHLLHAWYGQLSSRFLHMYQGYSFIFFTNCAPHPPCSGPPQWHLLVMQLLEWIPIHAFLFVISIEWGFPRWLSEANTTVCVSGRGQS